MVGWVRPMPTLNGTVGRHPRPRAVALSDRPTHPDPPVRPGAMQQALPDVRFVMVLRGTGGVRLPTSVHGDGALRLNATVPSLHTAATWWGLLLTTPV